MLNLFFWIWFCKWFLFKCAFKISIHEELAILLDKLFLQGANLSKTSTHIPRHCSRSHLEELIFSIDYLNSKYCLNVNKEKFYSLNSGFNFSSFIFITVTVISKNHINQSLSEFVYKKSKIWWIFWIFETARLFNRILQIIRITKTLHAGLIEYFVAIS